MTDASPRTKAGSPARSTCSPSSSAGSASAPLAALGGADYLRGLVAVALLGAAAQVVWLLMFGVNEQRWKEQADRAAESIWK